MDWENWSEWFIKLKWQLISFKFLAFSVVVTLISLFFVSLYGIFDKVILTVTELKQKGVIDSKAASDIITKTLEVLYNSAISHVMVASATVLTGIIAIQGVSYVMKTKQTQEIVKKMENGSLAENLKKFMPRK